MYPQKIENQRPPGRNNRKLWLCLLISGIFTLIGVLSLAYRNFAKKSAYPALRKCQDGEFVVDENEKPANKGAQASVSILRSTLTNQKYFFKAHRSSNVFRLERAILTKLASDQATPEAVCYMTKPERGIVMELARGGDLSSNSWYNPDNPFRFQNYEQLVQAAAYLVGSLAALHARGYLHNDLRPNNLIFTHPHQLRPIDFGLSRVIGKKGFHSRCLNNSPPETAYLVNHKERYQKINSTASDWYTAGVLLHFFVAKGLFCSNSANFEDSACVPGLQQMFWPYSSRAYDQKTKIVKYTWTPTPPVPIPSEFNDFLKKLIVDDPLQRDFRGKKLATLFNHPVFTGIDWKLINPNLNQLIN